MSIVTSTIALGIICLFGIPLAYVLARSTGRTARAITVAVQLPLALPPLIGGILLVYLVGPYTTLGRLFNGRLTESIAGIVIAQTFVAAPFLVAVAKAALSDVDPALYDVARTLGYGELACFARVGVPAARGAIRTGMLLSWLRAFGEYGDRATAWRITRTRYRCSPTSNSEVPGSRTPKHRRRSPLPSPRSRSPLGRRTFRRFDGTPIPSPSPCSPRSGVRAR